MGANLRVWFFERGCTNGCHKTRNDLSDSIKLECAEFLTIAFMVAYLEH